MIFAAKIQNSKIMPSEMALYFTQITKHEGKEVEITLSEKKQTRTTKQNRYYFGVVVYLIRDRLEELGYRKSDLDESGVPAKLTADDVHEMLKRMFNRADVISPDAEVIGTTIKSTKELSTKEMNDYISQVVVWAAQDLELEIPDPIPTYSDEQDTAGRMADSPPGDDV
jgi:hypothetical protein